MEYFSRLYSEIGKKMTKNIVQSQNNLKCLQKFTTGEFK